MVIEKKTIVLLLAMVCIVALSGCTELLEMMKLPSTSGIIEYDDDVITIEYYSVSSLKPYAERPTTIRFFLRSNAQHDVENLVLNFFNIQGFSESERELYCDGADEIDDNWKCTYNTFEEGEEKKVWIRLMSPDKEKIAKPTILRVDYNVSYDYFGTREAHIPIVDEMTIVKPRSKFSQTANSYSPIHVSFEPPVGSVRIEDGVEIKEYWGTQNEPFELKMNFKHVGSSSIGTIGNLVIDKGAVTLRTSGLSIFNELPCDFDFVESRDEMVSTKSVKVPGTLSCYFTLTTENPLPEVSETVQAEFDFSYSFVRSQEFEVQPLSS
jgi:hypothetical protein